MRELTQEELKDPLKRVQALILAAKLPSPEEWAIANEARRQEVEIAYKASLSDPDSSAAQIYAQICNRSRDINWNVWGLAIVGSILLVISLLVSPEEVITAVDMEQSALGKLMQSLWSPIYGAGMMLTSLGLYFMQGAEIDTDQYLAKLPELIADDETPFDLADADEFPLILKYHAKLNRKMTYLDVVYMRDMAIADARVKAGLPAKR